MKIETQHGNFSFHCLAAGQFVGKEGWIHPHGGPGTYEIIYMLQGQLSMQEGLAPYIAMPGEVLTLSADLPRFGMTPSNKKLSFYWADIEIDDPDVLGLQVSCKVKTENGLLETLFKQLLMFKGRDDYPEEAADYAAMLLLSETAMVQKNAAVRCPKVLRDITEWIRANICSPITATEVGSRFSYNPDYLTALFKEYFGIGLKEYINTQKLKKAEEYLKATDCPVKEIAAILGFDSANKFIKYFTYHKGTSPARYRQGYYNQKM